MALSTVEVNDTTVTIGDNSGNDRLLIVIGTEERSPIALASNPPVFNSVTMNELIVTGTTSTAVGIWYLTDSELPASAGDYTLTPPSDDPRGYASYYCTGMDQTPGTNALTDEAEDSTTSPMTLDFTGAATSDLQIVVGAHTTNSAAFTVDTSGFTDDAIDSSAATASFGAHKDGSVGTSVQVSVTFDTTTHQLAGASFPAESAGASVGHKRLMLLGVG